MSHHGLTVINIRLMSSHSCQYLGTSVFFIFIFFIGWWEPCIEIKQWKDWRRDLVVDNMRGNIFKHYVDAKRVKFPWEVTLEFDGLSPKVRSFMQLNQVGALALYELLSYNIWFLLDWHTRWSLKKWTSTWSFVRTYQPKNGSTEVDRELRQAKCDTFNFVKANIIISYTFQIIPLLLIKFS
jgi:hypothetical protein